MKTDKQTRRIFYSQSQNSIGCTHYTTLPNLACFFFSIPYIYNFPFLFKFCLFPLNKNNLKLFSL